MLQVQDAAGERGGLQPSEPALQGHPDAAGSSGCGARQRHRAHGQRDQPVAAMGGEHLQGCGDAGGMGMAVGMLPQSQAALPKRLLLTAKSFPFPD